MTRRSSRAVMALALAAGLVSIGIGGAPGLLARKRAPIDTFRLVRSYPHDPAAYTQGLIYRDGFLFESTGLNGRSTLRKVALESGEVVRQHALDAAYFAEGLAAWKGLLVQLTWQSHVAFVYDLTTFSLRRTLSYAGEGWGLTSDENGFILSDGSDHLRFLDPDTFREVRRLPVTDGGIPVRELNELEYINGEVYANVWHTDRIARISPKTGQVVRWIDLRGLMPGRAGLDPEAVLNGIAYDAARNRLFVTGKLWPRLFEIEVVSAAASGTSRPGRYGMIRNGTSSRSAPEPRGIDTSIR